MSELIFQTPRTTGLTQKQFGRRIIPAREPGYAIRDILDSEMPFLLSIIDDLHSMVLVGSGAFDQLEAGSDTDIVIIPENDRYEKVADALLDRAIQVHYKKGMMNVEYTPLDISQTERHFRTGSPFAFALRQGIVLWDDGLLKRLVCDNGSVPHSRYYLDAFRDSVVFQYFGTLNWFDVEVNRDHGLNGRCSRAGRCLGHSPADNLARVIMNMLYVTLPLNGHMPLMKKDVLTFSAVVYGRRIAEIVGNVIRIKRHGTRSIDFDTYADLKALAARLFEEILSMEEIRDEAGVILKEAQRAINEFTQVSEETTGRESLAA